jgi:hypothetical protein
VLFPARNAPRGEDVDERNLAAQVVARQTKRAPLDRR